LRYEGAAAVVGGHEGRRYPAAFVAAGT
jgi:hypothetical protein